MNNDTPNSNSKNESNGYYTPADKSSSQDYQNLVEDYHHTTKRERAVQIGGSLLSVMASGIEIIIFILIYIIWERRVPFDIIGRVSGIFITLLLILVLGVSQLRTVSRWNRNIEGEIKTIPTTQPPTVPHNQAPSEIKTQKLTQFNYERMDQTKRMRVLAGIILILCVLFFFQFQRTVISSVPVNFLRIYYIYRGLRLLAFLIVICYCIIESIQFIKWTVRLRRMRILENRIITEIPEIAILDSLKNEPRSGR